MTSVTIASRLGAAEARGRRGGRPSSLLEKVLRRRRRLLLLLPLPFVLAFVLRRIPLPSGRARKAKAAKAYVPPAVVAEEEEGSGEGGADGAGGSFGAESRAEPSAAGRKFGGRDGSGGEPREAGPSAAALAGGAPPAARGSGGGAAGVGAGVGGLRTRASSPASDPYALARSQSHGFFYDVTDAHWKRLRRIFEAHEDHRYPYAPWTHHPSQTGGRIEWAWSSYEAWYQENYEPNFSCHFEKRVGVPTNGDGGKWVCDPHRIRTLAKARRARDPSHPGCVVYSVGSNGDFTFELGVEKETGPGTCEFHIFDMGDYEEKARYSGLKRVKYHRWGLTGKDGMPVSNKMRMEAGAAPLVPDGENKFYSLQETVRMLGHDELDIVDIFKIDCEKCEWDTYRDWLSPEVPLLHQILVEVHKAPRPVAIDFFASLEKAGYVRFHKEPNIQYEPSCIEYAFVKVGRAFVEGKRGDGVVEAP